MQDSQSSKHQETNRPTAVVGIGCATGGMDALEVILRDVPKGIGAAYIIAQHVNTGRSEILVDVISSMSSLSVTAFDESPVQLKPNHIYLLPQRSVVRYENGGFAAVREEHPDQRATVIDGLFRTIAEYVRVPAVGILLSGSGGDGTWGLGAIRDAGGLTIAQDLESAKQSEMPQNAAAVADLVLSPKQVAGELAAHIRHLPPPGTTRHFESQAASIEATLPELCDALLAVTEYEFRHYKKQTLIRRISRRMQVLRIDDADDYLRHLRAERDEARALFRELLVSVTAFFRDPDTFATLAEQVLPKLFERRMKGEAIRIWVPGCATGQEAYTLAMLMTEERDKHDADIEIQLFATDIDQRALNIARNGIYPASISEELTERRLERFFKKTGKQYAVRKELRDLCSFSIHNLVSDPPFSQLDLISCRNLLIYLGQPLQLKLIPVFHFALRGQGYLLLGPSENLTSHTEIFRPIDKKHRISQRKPGPARSSDVFPAGGRVSSSSRAAGDAPHEFDIHRISQRIVLDEFAPRYAIINADGHLVCTSTGLGPYFEFPDGPFANNVIKIAKSGLRSGLRAALRESKETLRTVVRDGLTLKTEEGVQQIRLTVQPMPEIGEDANLFMIVFQERSVVASRKGSDATLPDAESAIEQLERELEQTRTELEKTVRDLEGANEELKSTNEELRSLNEEQRSANEELETSKDEISAGMDALARARSDLQNLLDGTRLATIFLDAAGNIKSFTPTVTDIYNIRDADLGRPLTDITHKAREMPPVPTEQSIRLADEYVEHEIQTSDSRWFLRRVLPYRYDDQPDGIILTFVDISAKKRDEIRLKASHSITQLMVDADSFEDAIPAMLESLRDALHAEVCSLWLVDGTTRELYCAKTSVARSSDQLDAFVKASQTQRFKRGSGLPGHVWKTKEPFWIKDATMSEGKPELHFQRHRIASQAGLVSGIALPVITGTKLRGVIEVFTDRSLGQEQSLLDMLGDVGREIGQFIRRKSLDEQLRNEQARTTAILQASLDCIVTMDVQGKIVEFNPAAEKTFGYSKAEVVGKLLADVLIPEESRAAHRKGMARYLRTGVSSVIGRRVELTARRSDGSHFPVELAINVSHNRDGSPFFTAYLRDITQERASKVALRDSESFLRRTLDSLAAFVGVCEPDGTLVQVNQPALDLSPLGDQIIGRRLWETPAFAYDEAIQQQIRQAVQRAGNGEPTRFDVPIRVGDEDLLYIDFQIVPMQNDEGRITHLIPSGVDINERKVTEQELTDAKLRLDLAMEVSEVAAWGWNMRTNDVLANPNLNRLFGFQPNDQPDLNAFLLRIDDSDRERVAAGVERSIAQGESFDDEYRINLPSGDTRWVRARGHVRTSEHGKMEDFFGVVADITQLKQNELELASRAAHLREAQELAESASRAKSEFVANMSHEIRTPMTAVLGYADLLLARENDPEKLTHLQTIQRNGNFLLEIINDILDLSKIEAGKIEITTEWFSIAELVGDVRSMMQLRASERDLDFNVEFDGTVPERIESDPKRLRQILINLIGNAIKFTKQGTVLVTVREVQVDGWAYIQFDVADTGIGMSDEQQSRLFKVFSQGDASVSRSFGGTGLGLAISQRLALMLNGEIIVDSKEGEGSTFTCTIAAGDVSNQKRIQPILDGTIEASAKPGNAVADGKRLNCRVLVVDDRRDVRFLSKALLTKAGAEVEEVEDGVDAIARLESDPNAAKSIDLILLDMQMPRLDGYQTATRLRRLGFDKPIVALTADAMQSDMNRCIEAGCNEFLSKPIDGVKLIETVSRLVSADGSRE